MSDRSQSAAADKIASLQSLGELKKNGTVSDEEFEKLKAEILGEQPRRTAVMTEEKEDLDAFSKSLFDNNDLGNISEAENKDDLEDFSKSLFRMDESSETSDISPITAESSTYTPQRVKKSESLIDDIDFSLDLDDVPDINNNSARRGSPVNEALNFFRPLKDKYSERDCALMDAESLSRLSVLPLFLMGAAAAGMFYMVMQVFLDMTGGLTDFLLLLCLWAGIMPAAVIIPNTVKLNRKNRKAREVNAALEEYYRKSGFTEIPFEYTSPYILPELAEIIESGKADGIRSAVEILRQELSSEDLLAAEKKRADFSDNDELAARSAALYVAGKNLLYELE